MQQIAGNANWEVNYSPESNTYFLYDLNSDDTLTITTPEDFIEMGDMIQAHLDDNLIQ
uniref:Uncharacterized protein n=1 Tax=Yangshan Harbor Nitrososphaeria virus TaxID=2969597 RepID=A0A976UBT6_9CAUD|nr:hypothetical protein [Yangshan Harbor Nitrososphaeria virus]